MKEDAKVFKLVGPVLVRQDVDEAKANVKTRLSYIDKELERTDRRLKENKERSDRAQEKCMKISGKLQKEQQAEAQAAEGEGK